MKHYQKFAFALTLAHTFPLFTATAPATQANNTIPFPTALKGIAATLPSKNQLQLEKIHQKNKSTNAKRTMVQASIRTPPPHPQRRWYKYPAPDKKDLILSDPDYITLEKGTAITEDTVSFNRNSTGNVTSREYTITAKENIPKSHWLASAGIAYLVLAAKCFYNDTAPTLATLGYGVIICLLLESYNRFSTSKKYRSLDKKSPSSFRKADERNDWKNLQYLYGVTKNKKSEWSVNVSTHPRYKQPLFDWIGSTFAGIFIGLKAQEGLDNIDE